ncbi:MAG: DUF2318 domain-containing protein [archaeon]
MKFILFLFLFAVLVFAGCVSDSTGNFSVAAAQQVPTDSISIPLSSISENAKWFEFESNGTTIRFFAVKASDGSIKTAFDACDVCFASKKGYSQNGNEMVCNNCGNKYPIDGLGTENKNGGGCWPGFLPNKVVGDSIVIKKSDLDKGRYRFE